MFPGAEVFSGGMEMLNGDGSPVAQVTSAALGVVLIIAVVLIATMVRG